MKYLIWGVIVLLLVLHHDFWFWDDATLLWGRFPVGLVYHVGLSLAASLTWLLATKYAWPLDVHNSDPVTNAAADLPNREAGA